MKSLKFILAVSVIFAIFSCGKEKDTVKPVITLQEPEAKDTFSVGADSLHVQFVVTDDKGLANYSYVIKDSFGNKYYQGSNFISGTTYTHHGHVIFGGFSGVKELQLYVQAYDQGYNNAEVSQTFFIQP